MVAVSYPPGASGAFVSLPMICHIESVVWPVKFRICHHCLIRNLSQSRYTHSSVRSLLSAQQPRDRSYDPTLSREGSLVPLGQAHFGLDRLRIVELLLWLPYSLRRRLGRGSWFPLLAQMTPKLEAGDRAL